MKRFHHLKQVLPSWTRANKIDEIIIVNWGMHDPVRELVTVINDPRITVIEVPDRNYFDSGKTRNVGIRHAKGEWILTLDADSYTDDKNFLADINLDKKDTFYLRKPETAHDFAMRYGGGTCLVRKETWEHVNGYVEKLPCWGHEDGDFYKKLEKNGLSYRRVLKGINRIPHSDEDRTGNFPCNDRGLKRNEKNEAFLKTTDSFTQKHEIIWCQTYQNRTLSNFTMI